MQAAAREALSLSTRPVHVLGGSFHPRCSSRSAIGLPWLLGRWLQLRAERTELAWLAIKTTPCLVCRSSCPALASLSCVSVRRSRLPQKSSGNGNSVMLVMCQGQACRAAPSLRKKRLDPGASAVEQARYSSELRTDGAGPCDTIRAHFTESVAGMWDLGLAYGPQHQLSLSGRRGDAAPSQPSLNANWAIRALEMSEARCSCRCGLPISHESVARSLSFADRN